MAGHNNEQDLSAKKGADIHDGAKEVQKSVDANLQKDVQKDAGMPQSYDQAKATMVKEKGPLTQDNPNYYDQKSEQFAKTLAEFMKNPEQGIKTLTEQAKSVAAFCGAIETKIAATLKAQQAHEVLSGQRNA